ncbi:hypothetical protein B5X24_HaOG215545 [Helicoverpa armigera]|nr:hypothetical protein B5X24_HaOG215545 [Helicoverpa armigera]
MRKLLVNILVFWVGMCLSQDDKETKRYEGTTEPYKVMLKPNPLELFEPFERINFEDSKIVLKTDATVKICHHPNFKCMAKLNNPAPVCAYAKRHGLFNYEDICKIHIQNCLAQPLNTGYVYGVPTEHGKSKRNNDDDRELLSGGNAIKNGFLGSLCQVRACNQEGWSTYHSNCIKYECERMEMEWTKRKRTWLRKE